MAVGGLFGWMVFAKKKSALLFLHHPLVQAATYGLLIYFFWTSAHKPIFNYMGHAVLFGILILNVATNPRSFIRLRSRPFDFLGNISFSIYMFHEVAIQITLAVFGRAIPNALLYTVSLTLAILIASATYLWFERPFLRLKSRFTIVQNAA